jgi:hypothetical protein
MGCASWLRIPDAKKGTIPAVWGIFCGNLHVPARVSLFVMKKQPFYT